MVIRPAKEPRRVEEKFSCPTWAKGIQDRAQRKYGKVTQFQLHLKSKYNLLPTKLAEVKEKLIISSMAGEYVIKQGTNIFPLQFKIGTLLLEIFLATCIKDFKNDFFFFL